MQSSNNLESNAIQTTEIQSPVSEQQKAEAIRDFLFKQFNEKYQAMVQAINQAPLNQFLKDKVTTFLDTGYLWAKEAFLLMPIAPEPKVESSVPEQTNIVELPRKKRKYTAKKNTKNGKRKST